MGRVVEGSSPDLGHGSATRRSVRATYLLPNPSRNLFLHAALPFKTQAPDPEAEFAGARVFERAGGGPGRIAFLAEVIGVDCERRTVGVFIAEL